MIRLSYTMLKRKFYLLIKIIWKCLLSVINYLVILLNSLYFDICGVIA